MAWTATGLPYAVRDDGTVVRYMMSGVMQAIPDPSNDAELEGRGWGAARTAGTTIAPGLPERTSIPVALVGLILLLGGALATGYWMVAVALAIGACWFALQRRRASDRSHQGLSDAVEEREAHERSSLR
jgi:hypothetical protein